MSFSAGLLQVETLNVPGGAGSIVAANLNFDDLSVANDLTVGDALSVTGATTLSTLSASGAANVGGDLSIKGSQYTYDTSFCYITMGVNYSFVAVTASVLAGTSFQVKLELNRVGNQVTINFPSFSFYIPQYSAAGSIVSKSAGYLATTGNGIPVDYRPSSLVFQSTNAPNGTFIPNKRATNNTFLAGIGGSSTFVASMGGSSTFSIDSSGILLTISGYTGTPLTVNTVISGSGITLGTTIVSFGSGTGGNGTYYSNISQDFTGLSGSAIIKNNILTISGYSGTPLTVNTVINGSGITLGTTIDAFGTGTGGNGTYYSDILQNFTSVSGTAIIKNNVLTVTQAIYGSPLVVGQIISTTAPDSSGNSLSAAAGVFISGLGTGKGGLGTYYLNDSTKFVNNFTQFTNQSDDFSGTQINMPSYLVQITPTGKLFITGATTNTQQVRANYTQGIPVGINTILPFSMSYMVKDDTDVSDTGVNLNSTSVNVINTANWPASSGFHNVDCSGYSNFNQLYRYTSGGFATRDNQNNDCLNGNKYYSWADNSVQSNRIEYPRNDASGAFSAPVNDVMFRKIDVSGNIGQILQLTDNTKLLDPSSNYYIYNNSLVPTYILYRVPNPNTVVLFGTSVAVNRIRPNNVVVSWHNIIYKTASVYYDYSMKAVSFDDGITWPTQYNKPLNNGYIGDNGGIDDRGISCDMYGNFWWCRSNAVNPNLDSVGDGGLMMSVSSDGVTWYVAYNTPAVPLPRFLFSDSPTWSYGYDGTNSTVNTTVSGTQTLNCVDGSGNLTVGNTLNVVSATAFPTTGSFTVTDSSSVLRKIWYTGKTGTSFTGCIATDTFTSFTLNSTSTVQCLGKYGIWVQSELQNLPFIGYSTTNTLNPIVWFLPITGPLATGNTFTGYFGSGTGTDLSGCSNILTVTAGGPLSVGQQICGQNLTVTDSSWNRLPWYNVVDPSTTITSIIDGSHCTVSVPQNVASQTCYAVVSPLGQTATISGVTNKTVSTTITVSPSVANQTKYANVGTITVNNTTGAPAMGTIIVPNDSSGSVTLSYYGTTPTSFLNCTAWFNGVGGGFVLNSGEGVRLTNSPSYLTSLSGSYITSCTTANDGRMFFKSSAGAYFYKSKPNATYPDPVQSNWIGPINVQLSDAVNGSPTKAITYDDARQTLYMIQDAGLRSPADVNSISIAGGNEIATMYFRFSRDNGLTWSDPIIISDQFNVGLGQIYTQSTMTLDGTKGNLNFGFYNQTAPYIKTNNNLQYYALELSSSQINTLISGTTVFNTTYSVPPAVTPQIGGQLGVYGMMIIPQT